jgi:hypothetical protein
MLERVALGQSRFMTPGVAPDPRGVVLGRYALLVFPTLEGVVSWLRLYSAESSLDELLPGLSILRVRTPLRSRAIILQIPASSSYAVDRASRCARLVGGAAYTGTSKHFVKYRDERSPYGYDVAEVEALPSEVDFAVHGEAFTQHYAREDEIPFEKLLFRLSLRRVPGGERLRDDQRQELWLAVAPGLGERVIRYLWRNRVDAEVGLAQPSRASAFEDAGGSFLIARARRLPARILGLLLSTPGIDVFQPVAPNVAVQVGYAHVVDLASCASVFDTQRTYLFWGAGDRVDVLAGPLELSDIAHLTRLELEVDRPPEQRELTVALTETVSVPIQLAPSMSPPRHVTATLLPPEHGPWLKKLVFLLPQTSLRGHRVAVTTSGILLVADDEIDVVPLGQLLAEVASGLLVPLGMDLVPRVAPEVLARALGHDAGVYTVFPPSGRPFQIGEHALVPLERRAIAKIEVVEAEHVDARVAPPEEPALVNDPVGRFALWRFPATTETE